MIIILILLIKQRKNASKEKKVAMIARVSATVLNHLAKHKYSKINK